MVASESVTRLRFLFRFPGLRLLAASGLGLAVLACSTPYAVQEINPVDPATLPVSPLPEQPPKTVVHRLDAQHAQGDRDAASRAAEVAFSQAAGLEAGDPDGAASWYLIAASRAADALDAAPWPELGAPPSSEESRLLQIYNLSVDRYLRLHHEVMRHPMDDHEVASPRETFRITASRGDGVWDPADFDRLLSATGRLLEGFRTHYRRSGVGAPCIAYRENRHEDPVERFYPPEGIIRSATAVLHFGPLVEGTRSVSLAFHDPSRDDFIGFAGGDAPLAADFTAPYGFLVSHAKVHKIGKYSLLDPEDGMAQRGLYLLERYNPEKIPVLMVHGLWSSPLAWASLTNELLGTEELRSRYQVWHYFYPTGLPYLYSASFFRDDLRDMRRRLDPEGDDPAMQSLVAIGHSMGGLLVKTLVTDPGMKLWNTTFRVPPGALALPPEDLERLVKIFLFEPLPYVHRVIFVSTPHRGSRMAAGPVGRITSVLAELPQDVRSLFQRAVYDNPGAVTKPMESMLKRGGPTSVKALRPSHPVLRAFAEIPISPGVPFHTILGDKKQGGAVTDGVVSYDSGHLEGAESEIVVPSGHAAYDHPRTVAEIRRILRLHLEERS